MYQKPSYTGVNKLRYDSFSKNYQGKSGLVLSAFDGIDLSQLSGVHMVSRTRTVSKCT